MQQTDTILRTDKFGFAFFLGGGWGGGGGGGGGEGV